MIKEEIINELSASSDEAHKKGWISGGWGTWKDKTGRTVAKTVNGKLIPTSNSNDQVSKTRATRGNPPKYPTQFTQKTWGNSTGAATRRKNKSIWPDTNSMGDKFIGAKNLAGDVAYFKPEQEEWAIKFAKSYTDPKLFRMVNKI